MGFNFPLSPIVGTLYPDPAIAGAPQYVWDGAVWKTTTTVVTGSNFVLKAGDTMTGALQLPANPTLALQAATKQYVDVAAMNAMSYSGMQINGSCEVSQEFGTTVTTAGSIYFLDGWLVSRTTSGIIQSYQVVNSTTFPGFSAYAQLQVQNVGPATPAAGDIVYIVMRIEGYRILRLAWGTANAQPITIGFWHAHTRTGLYSISVRNGDDTRSYIATYTQNVSDAAEYTVVTIPGCVDGTWASGNTTGMVVAFTMACGSTMTAPSANVWYAAHYRAAPGQVNAIQATSDRLRITGVVVLPGIYAPTAQQSPLIMRPFDQELMLCQRYWRRIINIWNLGKYGTAAGAVDLELSFSPMRATPTGALVGTFGYQNTSGLTVWTTSLENVVLRAAVTATAASGFFSNPDGAVTLDARL
jgi:hypothetical protein